MSTSFFHSEMSGAGGVGSSSGAVPFASSSDSSTVRSSSPDTTALRASSSTPSSASTPLNIRTSASSEPKPLLSQAQIDEKAAALLSEFQSAFSNIETKAREAADAAYSQSSIEGLLEIERQTTAFTDQLVEEFGQEIGKLWLEHPETTVEVANTLLEHARSAGEASVGATSLLSIVNRVLDKANEVQVESLRAQLAEAQRPEHILKGEDIAGVAEPADEASAAERNFFTITRQMLNVTHAFHENLQNRESLENALGNIGIALTNIGEATRGNAAALGLSSAEATDLESSISALQVSVNNISEGLHQNHRGPVALADLSGSLGKLNDQLLALVDRASAKPIADPKQYGFLRAFLASALSVSLAIATVLGSAFLVGFTGGIAALPAFFATSGAITLATAGTGAALTTLLGFGSAKAAWKAWNARGEVRADQARFANETQLKGNLTIFKDYLATNKGLLESIQTAYLESAARTGTAETLAPMLLAMEIDEAVAFLNVADDNAVAILQEIAKHDGGFEFLADLLVNDNLNEDLRAKWYKLGLRTNAGENAYPAIHRLLAERGQVSTIARLLDATKNEKLIAEVLTEIPAESAAGVLTLIPLEGAVATLHVMINNINMPENEAQQVAAAHLIGILNATENNKLEPIFERIYPDALRDLVLHTQGLSGVNRGDIGAQIAPALRMLIVAILTSAGTDARTTTAKTFLANLSPQAVANTLNAMTEEMRNDERILERLPHVLFDGRALKDALSIIEGMNDRGLARSLITGLGVEKGVSQVIGGAFNNNDDARSIAQLLILLDPALTENGLRNLSKSDKKAAAVIRELDATRTIQNNILGKNPKTQLVALINLYSKTDKDIERVVGVLRDINPAVTDQFLLHIAKNDGEVGAQHAAKVLTDMGPLGAMQFFSRHTAEGDAATHASIIEHMLGEGAPWLTTAIVLRGLPKPQQNAILNALEGRVDEEKIGALRDQIRKGITRSFNRLSEVDGAYAAKIEDDVAAIKSERDRRLNKQRAAREAPEAARIAGIQSQITNTQIGFNQTLERINALPPATDNQNPIATQLLLRGITLLRLESSANISADRLERTVGLIARGLATFIIAQNRDEIQENWHAGGTDPITPAQFNTIIQSINSNEPVADIDEFIRTMLPEFGGLYGAVRTQILLQLGRDNAASSSGS